RSGLLTLGGRTVSACPPGAWRASHPSTNCYPNAEWCRQRNSVADGVVCETGLPSWNLHVEIAHIQRVVFDELPAWFDDVSHQNREHFIGIDGVVVVQVHLQEFAFLRIHRGLEQLLGVHFTETFETLDLHPAAANLQNLLQDFGN